MSQTAAEPSPSRFSVAHLLLVVPWVALVIDAWAEIRDNSFLWHIRAGELQAEESEQDWGGSHGSSSEGVMRSRL